VSPVKAWSSIDSAGRPAATGLTEREAAALAAAGKANTFEPPSSRTVAEILRANVFTRFNAILGVLLGVIVVVGPAQDAMFGVVLVTNTAIGVLQEVRAKRALDRLALLSAFQARVVRDGQVRAVDVQAVVLGDVVEASAGDEIVVDGSVLASDGLEVDESLLTGESVPCPKQPGGTVLSGSFVVAGAGRYRATAVGADAYAAKLAVEARRFQFVRSELRSGIDRILRLVTWLLLPTAVLLVITQLAAHDDLHEALRSSVAGIGSMIPEGLVLLTTVAFAAGAMRLSRQRVLVQELAALEGLARVDVVCIDKTGTLTAADLDVDEVLPTDGPSGASRDDVREALAAVAAADPHPNRTAQAIASSFPSPPPWTVVQAMPFSSDRKWSAVEFADHGTWVLGAPDVLLSSEDDAVRSLREEASGLAAGGARVVLFGRVAGLGPDDPAPVGLGGSVEPVALVTLRERVREEVPAALQFLAEQGVAVKVLSGDHPATVAAVAERAGVQGAGSAKGPVDARQLPGPGPELAAAMEAGTVFGRVLPHQKRDMVRALQSLGHVVAMTGDGVNDVPAVKQADVGLAMGSGTPATRSVARLVLLDDSFATFPAIVAEGRRVIANIERVANLFVTKTAYAFALAVAVIAARFPFPFLPRHLTVISSLTIGIPGFFLALAPATQRARPGFVGRVLAFAVPAGLLAAAATFAAYAVARTAPATTSAEARTAATATLFGVGIAVLLVLAAPLTRPRLLLVAGMVAAFITLNAVPSLREFFALDPPNVVVTFAVFGVIALADVALVVGWTAAHHAVQWWRGRVRTGPTPTG